MDFYTEIPPSQTCGIYIIKNIVNNKVYVGESIDIHRRWIQHKSNLKHNRHENEHLQRAWNKYGEESFEFIIISECNESELNNLEKKFIEEYKSRDGNYGYNLTTGGDGCVGLRQETIEKIRKSLTGKHHSEETRKKMSESQKNKKMPPRSDEHRKNLGQALKGKDAWNKGIQMDDNFKEKFLGSNNPNHRCVYCIELDEHFGSTREVERKYGISHSNICVACKDNTKAAGKHPVTGEKLHWRYCEEANVDEI